MAHAQSAPLLCARLRPSGHSRAAPAPSRWRLAGLVAVFLALGEVLAAVPSAFVAAELGGGRTPVGPRPHRNLVGSGAKSEASLSLATHASGAASQSKASPVALSALSWLPNMPQTCEDDFECNDGKANFPLQCIDFVFARICVDPDDFQQAPQTSATPAYVPIPVPVEENPWN
mmetsp:Transcript_18723/g.51423  ORF Transcript_18723/g.51423 Transcript_18723/m.51423 type:complete len:174 (-) Transcript_18723:119-640(-)